MQFVLIVAVVLLALATGVGTASLLLTAVLRLVSKLR